MALSKRQHEIVDAAIELAARQGMANLTVKNLSAAVGVTEPALYRHFSGKNAIVSAMIDRFDIVPETGRMSEIGLAAVEKFIRKRLAGIESSPALARIMFAEEMFSGDESAAARMRDMRERHTILMRELLRQARSRGEIRTDIPVEMLFCLVMGAVRMLVKQWGMNPEKKSLSRQGEELLVTLRTVLKPEVKP